MKTLPKRQSIRRALILVSFLLFPVTIDFFSPYLIVDGASQGVINGSWISFALMFVSALFLGRGWCGWVCPAGGLQEACMAALDKKVRGPWADRVKWLIWSLWILLIAVLVVQAGGYVRVNPFHLIEDNLSPTQPASIYIYYAIKYFMVVGLIVSLSWTVGNRGMCHSACWMAPFLILGRKIRNLFAWPSLRLAAQPEKCTNCMSCVRACPMSLDVNGLVARGSMEHNECILCGTCVDTCAQHVIRYSFSSGR